MTKISILGLVSGPWNVLFSGLDLFICGAHIHADSSELRIDKWNVMARTTFSE